MSKIKVSIIVPVYNVEKYLSECLNSILSQTLHEIEVICVNDGSTDNSLAILKQYELKDSRIRIIDKINNGLGAARNSGIAVAQGEYIGFVDSDDFIERTMFEKMYTRACKIGADVVITNLYLYYTDTGFTSVYRDMVKYYFWERKGSFSAMQNPEIVQNIGVWDKIYRLDFIKKYQLRNPEHRIFEDALFTFQTLILSKSITVISEPLYYYRKNTGIAITDKEVENDNYKFDFLKNSREIREFITNQNVYSIFISDFLQYQFKFAVWHQGNATTFKTFKRFFCEMQEMTNSDDYNIIKGFSSKKLVWYAERLRKNQLIRCFVFFRIKRLIFGK